jgi:hypothetical protein
MRKVCNKCQKELNLDCFSLKDTLGHRRGTCKKCIIISKAKFTCDIPPNTRQCGTCNEITQLEDFSSGRKNCSKCRIQPTEQERRTLLLENKKKCTRCCEIKTLDFFRKKHLVGQEISEISYCKVCENKKRSDARLGKKRNITEGSKNYQKLKNEINRQEKIDNPEKHRLERDTRRCRRFKISIEDYHKMKEAQNCKCYLCGLDEKDNTHGTLVIDHCHKTNKIRKLLCNSCNVILGSLKEDLEYIEKIKNYLIEHKEP